MSGYRCPLRGKDDMEAAAPPLSDSRRAGYGAAPPASRVLRIAARRPAAAPDPAASAAPERPPTRAGQAPAPDRRAAVNKIKKAARSTYSKPLRFQGIATGRPC
jgi:hypothetical protein